MANATLVNFAGGETSPKSRGRFDIASYTSSCRKLVNFIAEVSGPARFRPGFKHISETRSSGVARIIPFQSRDSQAYMLEFTPGKMRVYKNGALLTLERTTVTDVTQAIPGVLTVTSGTGLAAGDDVVITDVVGMEELNGRVFRLGVGGATFFPLLDPNTGASINTMGYGAYVSGGTVRKVYEVTSPYIEDDLEGIQFSQTADEMYINHYRYTPRKLTRDTADVFTLATYVRTADPFTAGDTLTVVGIALGTSTIVTLAAGSFVELGAHYTFSGVVGTTEINTKTYRLTSYLPTPAGLPRVYILDVTTLAHIDSSAWTAYTSGGEAAIGADNPLALTFYENRLVHAGTNLRPRTLFLSMAPDSAGAPRFDTFTGGASADDACFFSLAPINGTVDYIAWAGGSAKYLLIGTFGGTFRISGGGLDEPITPSSVNVRQLDAFGCAATMPVLSGSTAYFIQRGGKTLRGVGYASDADDVTTFDACLNADQIGDSELKRAMLQTGRPDTLWVVRADGQLAGMTLSGGERVAGWHRHKIGGADAKVLDVGVLPRPGDSDQLYIVTERTIQGITHRAVEVLADDVVYPDPEDFYSAESAGAADEEKYMDAVYRLQERYIHLDAAATYNGGDRFAGSTGIIGATTGAVGTPGNLHAYELDGATPKYGVFSADDVGKEIWIKPGIDTGVGRGRGTISNFVNTSFVQITVLSVFDGEGMGRSLDQLYIASDEISGLWHLEGQRVAVVADGAVYSDGATDDYPTVTVAHGAITLSRNCAVVHVGLPYEGMLITHNLEMGGASGPAQDKPRNIVRMALRFLNSLGCEFGTSLYRTEKVVHNSNKFVSDRPTPVFSGVKIVHNSDNWKPDSGDKNVVIVQKLPLPCVVQFIDVHYETGDE